MGVLIAVAVFGLIVLVMGVQVYNNLVGLKNQVERSWANIDVILKQRFDEIPQLLKVIEQYAQYERGTIDRLVAARQKYGTAGNMSEKMDASKDMTLALRGVFAIGESYPDLKSNANFLQLQGRVSNLESTLADRREHYNESVTNLNTRIAQFPDMFFAGILGYNRYNHFTVSNEEKMRPELNMNLPS